MTSCDVAHCTVPCHTQGATRALVVKFADVKKTQSVKSWMLPEGRAALGLHGASVRPGSVGGYWQATAPSGRDVFGKGRQMYPDFNRGYPYQVSGVVVVVVLVVLSVSVMMCGCFMCRMCLR